MPPLDRWIVMYADYGYNPIDRPGQEMFGIDGFVQSLARSVRNVRSPYGVVISLNGPLGAGKSTVAPTAVAAHR